MYSDPHGNQETWLKETLELEGFVQQGFWRTQNEELLQTVEGMTSSVILALTYPDLCHPHPDMCAGVSWDLLCDGDEERRLQAIINLIDRGIVLDDDGLLIINPSKYQEAMDLAQCWYEPYSPPAGTETISLTQEGREILENNDIKDVAEWLHHSTLHASMESTTH